MVSKCLQMSVAGRFDSDWSLGTLVLFLPSAAADHCLLLSKSKNEERMAATASTELVYPLAFPKSISHKCEICGKTATRMCTQCRVTYYCSEEHQTADNVGIHEKICSALSALRSKQSFLPSEEERLERDREIRERKIHLTEMTRMIGERHVSSPICTALLSIFTSSNRFSKIDSTQPFLPRWLR